jgi:hypothetical protein
VSVGPGGLPGDAGEGQEPPAQGADEVTDREWADHWKGQAYDMLGRCRQWGDLTDSAQRQTAWALLLCAFWFVVAMAESAVIVNQQKTIARYEIPASETQP